jgi:DNA-binding NarL/FixJ family response regulator
MDRDLARKLARDAAAVEQAIKRRNDRIREAVEAGASYRDIAEYAGVSHQTVGVIVRQAR